MGGTRDCGYSRSIPAVSYTHLDVYKRQTVGNALRRILLSSLEGFAITTIRIDGVCLLYTSLRSAIANWEQKNERKAESGELFVTKIFVDGGATLKRMRPAPQGRRCV